MLRQIGSALKPLAMLAVLLVVWQVAVDRGWVPHNALASPSTTASYIIHRPGFLWSNTARTLTEVGIAFGIVVVFGTALAVLISQFRFLEESLYPLLVASQVIPTIATAPLLVLLFGFGLLPKIAVATVIAIFPILINTVSGLKSMPSEMSDLARSLGANPVQVLRLFSLPNAMPYFFAGARVSITLAVIGSVVGEFIVADKGLGYLVVQSTTTLDPALLCSALVFLAVMGLCLFSAVRLLEYFLVPWTHPRRESSLGDRGDLSQQSGIQLGEA
jgi:NitT/TauT family transport system permease protein